MFSPVPGGERDDLTPRAGGRPESLISPGPEQGPGRRAGWGPLVLTSSRSSGRSTWTFCAAIAHDSPRHGAQPERPGQFADTNVNKLGVTINVRMPRGLELIKRLITILMWSSKISAHASCGPGASATTSCSSSIRYHLCLDGWLRPYWTPSPLHDDGPSAQALRPDISFGCPASLPLAGAGLTWMIPAACTAPCASSPPCTIATPPARAAYRPVADDRRDYADRCGLSRSYGEWSRRTS